MTTRRVEAGDELFVSYGPGYWLSRQGISAEQIREAEEALGVEIRSGGALCEALQAALEAQPGGGSVVVADVAFGDVGPSDVAVKIRRGQYFWHARAAIGQIAARAVTQRVNVSEHTLRCIRASPNMQDDLAFPLRTLRGFKFLWAPSLCL